MACLQASDNSGKSLRQRARNARQRAAPSWALRSNFQAGKLLALNFDQLPQDRVRLCCRRRRRVQRRIVPGGHVELDCMAACSLGECRSQPR